MAQILVIEPSRDSQAPLLSALHGMESYSLRAFSEGGEALQYLAHHGTVTPGVIAVNGISFDGCRALISSLQRLAPHVPILLLAKSATAPRQAFLPWEKSIEILYDPTGPEMIRQSLLRLLTLRTSPSVEARRDAGLAGLVGNSPHLGQLVLRAKAYAHSRHPLLLRGERGTGKTLLAQAIMQEEGADLPFLQVCMYDSQETVSRLLAERPPGSSLILDFPLRSSHGTMADGRLADVCAAAERQDIRLIFCQRTGRRVRKGPQASQYPDIPTLNILPLRARPEDILAQFSTFSQRSAVMLSRSPVKLNEEAYLRLLQHDWPGNTRELLYFVFQLYMMYDGQEIDEEQAATVLALSDEGGPHPERSDPPRPLPGSAIELLTMDGELRDWESIEADYIRHAFHYYRGRKSEIARKTGLGRSTLYRKAKHLDIV